MDQNSYHPSPPAIVEENREDLDKALMPPPPPLRQKQHPQPTTANNIEQQQTTATIAESPIQQLIRTTGTAFIPLNDDTFIIAFVSLL